MVNDDSLEPCGRWSDCRARPPCTPVDPGAAQHPRGGGVGEPDPRAIRRAEVEEPRSSAVGRTGGRAPRRAGCRPTGLSREGAHGPRRRSAVRGLETARLRHKPEAGGATAAPRRRRGEVVPCKGRVQAGSGGAVLSDPRDLHPSNAERVQMTPRWEMGMEKRAVTDDVCADTRTAAVEHRPTCPPASAKPGVGPAGGMAGDANTAARDRAYLARSEAVATSLRPGWAVTSCAVFSARRPPPL